MIFQKWIFPIVCVSCIISQWLTGENYFSEILEYKRDGISLLDKVKNTPGTKTLVRLASVWLLVALIAGVLIFYSDTGYIEKIAHLRNHISFDGIPTMYKYNPNAVVTGALGVLFTGAAVAIFLVFQRIILAPSDDNLIGTAKAVVREEMPIIASIMACLALRLCVISPHFFVAEEFWAAYIGDLAYQYDAFFLIEDTSPILLIVCILCSILIYESVKPNSWVQTVLKSFVVFLGSVGVILLVYTNIYQLWYPVAHIICIVLFLTICLLWSGKRKEGE